MLNWIMWNWTAFDIETLLTLNWFVYYRTVLTLTVCKKNMYLCLTELVELELLD